MEGSRLSSLKVTSNGGSPRRKHSQSYKIFVNIQQQLLRFSAYRFRWSPLRYTMSHARARGFSFLFKNSATSNPLNMRSMYPGGSADIHLVKIKGNITPGNKEFSLPRNMRFFQVMTRTSLYSDMEHCVIFFGGGGVGGRIY